VAFGLHGKALVWDMDDSRSSLGFWGGVCNIYWPYKKITNPVSYYYVPQLT
jgi:hypothetical protein